MTRWAMVADLNRCVGCQTCTSACKHENATAPAVQWRKVLDFEAGEYPQVNRAFVPVGCMHCADPPCMDVCPSTATGQRADGIVTIDYDLCIGCSYCAVACPYQARWRVDKPVTAYGGKPMSHEIATAHKERRGVAQKCTFCIDRIDPGLKKGLVPGIDHEATPACVNSCIADALHFGDIEDPNSNVSQLLAKNKNFAMHEELGTGPGFFYLWEHGENDETPMEAPPMVAEPAGMSAVSSKLQKSWDWRAAANFMGGGTGTGLFIAGTLAGFFEPLFWPIAFVALGLVGAGLFFVWLEIGRPWRFINVMFHSKRSWMTREAMMALPFFGLGFLSLFYAWLLLWLAAALFAFAFLYCQGRILRAAKGIPAWRQEGIVPLIISTGMTEGMGLFGVVAIIAGFGPEVVQLTTILLVVLLLARYGAWAYYRAALGKAGAPTQTFAALDRGLVNLSIAPQLVTIGIVVLSLSLPLLLIIGGVLAFATGWGFKFTLITRAAYDQGFALNRMPARGGGESAPGIKPGWTTS